MAHVIGKSDLNPPPTPRRKGKPVPGLVGGKRGQDTYAGPPPSVTALHGATLAIPPTPPTRNRATPPGIAQGGAYRLRLTSPRPVDGYYVYAAGPYTLAYNPQAPGLYAGLRVYDYAGQVMPPTRGYYLRGLPQAKSGRAGRFSAS